MVALTTTRHFFRLTVLPCFAAVSSAIFHCDASASGPPWQAGPIEEHTAAVGPGGDHADGVIVLATAISKMRIAVGGEVQLRVIHFEQSS